MACGNAKSEPYQPESVRFKGQLVVREGGHFPVVQAGGQSDARTRADQLSRERALAQKDAFEGHLEQRFRGLDVNGVSQSKTHIK